MKKLFLVTISALMLGQNTLAANKCRTIKMLTSKIEKQLQERSSLEETIQLSEKLEDMSKWSEWSGIEKERQSITIEEAEQIFTAKEIDILLLADLLSNKQDTIEEQMGINIGVIGGSLGTLFITNKIAKKFINNGFRIGFMKKAHARLIGDNKGKLKTANKIRMFANTLSLVAPVYLGIKEYELYQEFSSLQTKIDLADELANKLPTLELLDERIESDRIMLERFKSQNTEECD